MFLTLTKDYPWKANYFVEHDEGTEEVLYEVDGHRQLFRSWATINKIDKQGGPRRAAHIDFHDKTIELEDGRKLDAQTFFRKKGKAWECKARNLGRDRVFAGPDGREFRWVLAENGCELFVNDDSQPDIILARFHIREFRSLFSRKDSGPPAKLEIFRAGEHMVDLILYTFIWMEKYRYDICERPEYNIFIGARVQ